VIHELVSSLYSN